jgi:hypothetical protein
LLLLKKEERSQINNLTLYLKEPGLEQTKLKASKKKEIRNVKTEINEIDNEESI